MTHAPALTCILTVSAGEGAGVAHSLQALLAIEGELEVLLVDHGADAGTRALLAAVTDPRLHVLRMAPAPRGAARNRGLAHAQGARLCVLAPGDTLAPFALHAITESAVDCLFLPAAARRANGQLMPTGQAVFDWLTGAELEVADSAHPRFAALLTRLALLPDAPGLRVVRHDLVQNHALSFAHDATSGWLFATGALMNADSLGVAPLPSVTLWEATDTGFATLSDAAQALHLFQRARHFHDPALRMALLGAVFNHLGEIARPQPDDDRQALHHGFRLLLTRLDDRMRNTLRAQMRARFAAPLAECAPWLGAALDIAQALSEVADSSVSPEPPKPPEPARNPRQSAIARLTAWGRGKPEGPSGAS